jgi:hypothetical protein
VSSQAIFCDCLSRSGGVAKFGRVYSFYLFEGSFHQGGGGWEHFEVGTDLDEVRRAAERYLRQGWWVSSLRDTCAIRTYQRGEVEREVNLYQFVQVKVPGLTRIWFGDNAERFGGEPEPGGGFEGVDPLDLEGAVLPELLNERPDEVEVTIAWADVSLTELKAPLLPKDAFVLVDHAEGTATAFGMGLSDEEFDEMHDELDEELTDDQVILAFGHNEAL